MSKLIRYSPWLAHFNTGACNGCDIEVLASITPIYDPERYGVKLSPSVRHGDILIVTGVVTKKAAERLRRLYEQMPGVKYVVAVGACAYDGGVFKGSYSISGGAGKVIPVDAYVPGCPPRPEEILRALLILLNRERVKESERH
ncbi:MAG: NADH-quinone oxidoreductase subunit B family protein [Ignisphaera sp.]|nr:NADH-quinone oxidoreductase subunit B family protein [Ignisphaera sp.]MCX8167883.1 NADH-quinone oxidoreductase subunit B family protein [Ignisphaera sp.]MDW8085476.1 NADH-quinone oxidoreductase subunit B family protein [Ignisphaera sp.]